jgi:TolA-binding protein
MKRIAAVLILLLALVAIGQTAPSIPRPDSITVAEAAKRGVMIEQVQLEQAIQKIADLQKQVDQLKAKAAEDARKIKQQEKRIFDLEAAAPATMPSVAETPRFDTPNSAGDTSSKTVHVRGYTRKDGTYVQPYNRRAPSR